MNQQIDRVWMKKNWKVEEKNNEKAEEAMCEVKVETHRKEWVIDSKKGKE